MGLVILERPPAIICTTSNIALFCSLAPHEIWRSCFWHLIMICETRSGHSGETEVSQIFSKKYFTGKFVHLVEIWQLFTQTKLVENSLLGYWSSLRKLAVFCWPGVNWDYHCFGALPQDQVSLIPRHCTESVNRSVLNGASPWGVPQWLRAPGCALSCGSESALSLSDMSGWAVMAFVTVDHSHFIQLVHLVFLHDYTILLRHAFV